ncbi:MAG: acyl-CoA dehydrogenase C-terminal domain-containing protein, partial [Burkholderiaceae bacterium]
ETAGRTVVAWIWLEQALAALRAAERSTRSMAFISGKLAACDWYFRCELPRNTAQHALLRRLDGTAMDMQAEWF